MRPERFDPHKNDLCSETTFPILEADDSLFAGEPLVAGKRVAAAVVGHGEHDVLTEPVRTCAPVVLVNLHVR